MPSKVSNNYWRIKWEPSQNIIYISTSTRDAAGSSDILQRLQLSARLEVHAGCVNTVAWNCSGSLLLSGSDDHRLVLTNPYTHRWDWVLQLLDIRV